MSTQDDIAAECDFLREFLQGKNNAYGDSILSPLRVFSDADEQAQLRVRIDDKLSRLTRGHAAGEDTVLDLIGYLIMLRISMRRARALPPPIATTFTDLSGVPDEELTRDQLSWREMSRGRSPDGCTGNMKA